MGYHPLYPRMGFQIDLGGHVSNKLWKSPEVEFRNLLRQCRMKKQLTQKELALLLERPQSYVSKYESGERRLDYLEVKSILGHLGLTITDFDEKLNGLQND